MSVLKINRDVLENLKREERPILLDFYADWCGPCRMMAPVVEELAAEHPEVAVGKVNTDEEMALAQSFGIVSIPTLIVIKNGEEKARFVGVRPKADLLAALQ